jgi:CheY-like chemotaxis protein
MLSKVEESMLLSNFIKGIAIRANRIICELPEKNTYTINLGHGLAGPFISFANIRFFFEIIVERGKAEPLDLSIMVVDDQDPEYWYQRMMIAGFKDVEKQQGFFYDCEAALEALEKGHYDVVLTDLELGEGKIDGIEFVEKAYEVQKRKGIKPRISVFSYNNEKLQEAEDKLRIPYFGGREGRVFHQVDHNNKANFSAISFRNEVSWSLQH